MHLLWGSGKLGFEDEKECGVGMKNKGFYMTALIACALGMGACAGGKSETSMQAEISDGEVQGDAFPERAEETEREQGIPGTTQDGDQTWPAETGTDGELQQTGEEKETAREDGAKRGAEEREERGEGQEKGEGEQRQDSEGQERGEQGKNPEGQGKEDKGTERKEAPKETDGENPGSGTADEERERSADGKIYIYFKEEAKEYKAEDGTVLLKTKISYPVIEISENGQAADAINGYIQEKGFSGEESIFGVSEEEAAAWAEEDYADRGKDNWYATYTIDAGYAVRRMDDRIISFEVWNYDYMGGAHPNSYSKGLTFDSRTGKPLMLEDIVEDMEEASAAVLEFLLKETKKEQYSDAFFDNYEEELPKLFSEDTWYLGEDGFHIIANTYSIAPYVAGSFDFVIPYAEADFLKPEFSI